MILAPPVIMALALTSSPGRTLRLAWPKPRYLALAVVMVVALNPVVNELRRVVEGLFPISDALKETLGRLMSDDASLWSSLLVFAVAAAICEEVAFRGFILSGLEHQRRTRSAIFLSALMFGFLHVLLSLFQQLFNATLLGVFLGLLAVRSRSLLPGIVFHALNNGFALVAGAWIALLTRIGLAEWIYREPEQGLYHGFWVGGGVAVAVLLFHYLWKLDRPRYAPRQSDAEPAA
jgi:sodium transport system permease protein